MPKVPVHLKVDMDSKLDQLRGGVKKVLQQKKDEREKGFAFGNVVDLVV